MTNEPPPQHFDAFTLDLRQGEEVFRRLVSAVKDYAIFMLDPEGKVMTWNEGAQRIKGYTAREIIGKHFSQFYTTEAKEKKHPQYELELAIKEGRYEEEGWRVRKDGSEFWANVVITPIYDDDKLIGFSKVTRDLTERRKAEQQRDANAALLAETNTELRAALEAKTRFLSTVSHEVRTPMAGIIGLAEILSEQDLGPDNNHIVESLFESSKRLLQLLNNLLETARVASGNLTLEFRQFPIRSVLGEVRQLVMPEAAKKHLQLGGTCDSRIPELLCGDELRIRQIFLNLAFNAVKFTEQGKIDISCTLKEQTKEQIVIRFTVTDTGIGIRPEDQGKLYQPFMQAEDEASRLYSGSGLGLSICKQLVELMHGTTGFESTYGKGSTFWVEIPFTHSKC